MAAVLKAHPTPDAIRAFGAGLLEPAAALAVGIHVGTCDTCCHLLEETPADDFVQRLRKAQSARAGEANAVDPGGATIDYFVAEVPIVEGVPPELVDHPRYRVRRLLGRGGMGAVYLAEHQHMGRSVALKVINPNLLHGRGVLERFQQEVRAAAALSHPNIVAAHDADHAGETHFLVMEYVEGETLAERLRDAGPLPAALACTYARQAALGLQHAHEKGMVHRDMKPANLMLTPNGQVKILDFGLARFTLEADSAVAADAMNSAHQSSRMTRTGAVLGTPGYISPEQARGERVDHRADLFSLGCILYEMTTGQRPFIGRNVSAILASVAADTPAPPQSVRSSIPATLSTLVMQLLEKKPDARPSSAGAVAEMLADIGFRTNPTVVPLAGGEARAADPWATLGEPSQSQIPEAVASTGPRRRRREWQVQVGLAFAVAFLVTAGAIIVRLARDREVTREQPKVVEVKPIPTDNKGSIPDIKSTAVEPVPGKESTSPPVVSPEVVAAREAIRLAPKSAPAYFNLGLILSNEGDLDGAIASYRQVIALNREFPRGHYLLGNALMATESLAEAASAFREASWLDDSFAEAHCNLGHALVRLGKFADGLRALKRGHDLGSKRKDWKYDSTRWILRCERRMDLETRLSGIRDGTMKPGSASETIEFAWVASRSTQSQYGLAFRLYTAVLDAEPELTASTQRDAARAAVRLAAGADADTRISNDEWYVLQFRAREWLDSHLKSIRKIVGSGTMANQRQARRMLNGLTSDPELLTVRSSEWLDAMPADVSKLWVDFWNEVADTRRRTLTQNPNDRGTGPKRPAIKDTDLPFPRVVEPVKGDPVSVTNELTPYQGLWRCVLVEPGTDKRTS